jgi:phage shock protein A
MSDLLPYTYGYQYSHGVRFNGGGEINGERPSGTVPVYSQRQVDELVAELESLRGKLREAEEKFAQEVIHKQDIRDRLAKADALVEKVRSTIKWTNEVYPSRIYAQGARVELTWDEFNAMREAAGFKPAKRIGDEEGNAGINHRLRVRIKELEAQLALSSTGCKP